jgi:hypothetical protein
MYSKKRLMIIGFVWLVAGTVVFGVAPQFGADADPRGCDVAPCAFPAESNVGGIVLGTDQLIGNNLVSFGYPGGDPGFYYDDVPPGRVVDRERNIGLGISDVSTGNFFIYKQWYYFDDRTEAKEPVHIWANATDATLTSIGTTNNDCGVSDISNSNGGWERSTTCDLVANVSELSSKYIYATTDCVSGLFCFAVPGSLEINNYHAVNPEEDTCGAIGALGGTVCLGLIKNGGSSVLGTTVASDRIEAYDLQIRGHEFKAVNGPNGQNKRLTLNNAYIEIRHGKGYDRIYTPDSNPSDPNGNYGGTVGSNPDWGQPVDGPTGRSALGVNFPCEGGGPSTFCGIKNGRIQNRQGESYDNIYR